jgi:hypothetical protein
MISSLLETCKLNSVDPLAWLTDVLTKLVNLWPASRIDELMPYAAFRVMPRRSTNPVEIGHVTQFVSA